MMQYFYRVLFIVIFFSVSASASDSVQTGRLFQFLQNAYSLVLQQDQNTLIQDENFNCETIEKILSPNSNEPEVITVDEKIHQQVETQGLKKKHKDDVRRIALIVGSTLKAVVDSPILLVQEAESQVSTRKSIPHADAYETPVPPKVDLKDYILRVADLSLVSPATVLSAFILMDQLTHKFSIRVTMLNVYKLFLVSLRVASKALDIRNVSNKVFANIGGISWQYMNDLESIFLVDMAFDVMIFPEQFRTYSEELLKGCKSHGVVSPAQSDQVRVPHPPKEERTRKSGRRDVPDSAA